jgi:hypothetical protein
MSLQLLRTNANRIEHLGGSNGQNCIKKPGWDGDESGGNAAGGKDGLGWSYSLVVLTGREMEARMNERGGDSGCIACGFNAVVRRCRLTSESRQ